MAIRTCILLAAVAAGALTGAAGQTADGYDPDAALAVSQAALGNEIGELEFRDVYGEPVTTKSLRGKPLVVSLVYTSCHHICPMITRNLAKTQSIAREALGERAFNVITVGFDSAVDTPDRMRMFAAGQGIDEPNWYFLSGNDASVAALSETTGFQFVRSAKGFDHLLQTTIVDAEGRVYRQVYGQTFDAPALVEPLKELVYDTPREASLVRHWVDRFRLFCTVFDPNSGRYAFDYSILMTIVTGILSLGAIAFFIVNEWRRS